jgi:hypothetical protein
MEEKVQARLKSSREGLPTSLEKSQEHFFERSSKDCTRLDEND